ncbi:hypothetical protein [Streptomyces beihaiensis]|uniref:RCK C-terminal domain-containing protein n=1 Tax=Streptomyces beihaiensis TaxID=2984495 RepID=A0ABT3TU26_9ACTN|nr:hypothetical protein [Streptomyces beihaiensis]MCX3059590.1 hypothetical protein [Streptomyces beihaiensis]
MNPIVRRWGTSPVQRGSASGATCPDVLELRSSDFMVIGKAPGVPHVTAAELREHGAGIGPGEQAVIIPRDVMLAAARQIVQEWAVLNTAELAKEHE